MAAPGTLTCSAAVGVVPELLLTVFCVLYTRPSTVTRASMARGEKPAATVKVIVNRASSPSTTGALRGDTAAPSRASGMATAW